MTLTHSGRLTVEPEGRIVIARIGGKDDYLTTMLDVTRFDSIRLLESIGAITLVDQKAFATFQSVTIARLSQAQARAS